MNAQQARDMVVSNCERAMAQAMADVYERDDWYDERVQVEPDEPLFIPDEDDFSLGAGLLADY